MEDAYILACGRSPMTKAGRGPLASARIDDVAAQVLRGVISRLPAFDPASIEDVLVGCAMPEGEQGLNVARNISFLAGLPVSVAASTVNRFCASSLEAIGQAVRAIKCRDGEVFVAGGIESMSHVPMGGFNASLNERLMREGAPDAYVSMGLTAENVAREREISRGEQDRFALASHMKAVSAVERGKFSAELVSVKIESEEGDLTVSKDDGPRADTSLEALSALQPAFLAGGSVTAGNSSPLTDGAAMAVIASKGAAKRIGARPLAKVRAFAVSGCDPALMGLGPIHAVPKALARAGIKMKKLDLVELNEAFASQAIACVRELSIDERKLNVNGGAIALGHPLGMSGARIITTLVYAMQDRGAAVGMAAMCVGGGQGAAMIIERV
ncbi:MAG TPA: thiolase family protein [bacterium]|nr:thiolase family protein [bacterium]